MRGSWQHEGFGRHHIDPGIRGTEGEKNRTWEAFGLLRAIELVGQRSQTGLYHYTGEIVSFLKLNFHLQCKCEM